MTIPQTQPHRILAVHVARIGDTLLTTAALRHLSKIYPNAQIDFLGHAKRIEVLEHLPYLHYVGGISKKTARCKGWCAKLMGRKPYDLTFVWGHDPELVAYARRVSKRLIISRQLDEAANRLADQVVDFPNDTNLLSEAEDKPLAQWILDVVEQGTQTKAESLYTDYVVTPQEAKAAQALLSQHTGKNPGVQLIGLVVESHPAGAHRDWPIENFVELTRQLATEHADRYFVLIGGPLPEAKILALRVVLGDRLIDLSGKLSLRQSAAVMNELDLYVAVDTGPSHIAAALGTPSVVMFHCMRAGEYLLAPRFPKNLIIVNHPLARVQCSFIDSMSAITTENVAGAVGKQLNARQRGALKVVEPTSYYENTRSELSRFVPAQHRRVLEIGCGSGNFRVNCLPGCEYWGVEPDAKSAEKARQKLDKVLFGFYDSVESEIPDGYFDLIVCNDVIEHLPDHQKFLTKIKSKLAQGGVLIGSVPNVRFLPYLMTLIFDKDWRYENSGVLDKTHLRFFTALSLKRSFVETGYIIEEFSGLNPITLRWGSLKKALRSCKVGIQLLIFGKDTRFMQYGFRVALKTKADGRHN